MKLLLINPPFEQTFGSIMPKKLEEGLDFLPPLGLLYVAASVEKTGRHLVEIIDAQVDKLDAKMLKEEITKRRPDAIGVTAMTFTLLDVIQTIKMAKDVDPKIKIILSGPHVIIYPEETMTIKEVDFLVLGEGEKTINLLLDNINKPYELAKIKGLFFRRGQNIINTGPADFIEDLNELPFPARHLAPYKKYFSVVSARRPVTTMFSSRGCPYQCLFCDRPQVGKRFRARSAKNVVDEMQLCQNMGIKEIFIYDDTFAVDRQRVMEICSEIIKRDIKIAWDIRTRVNTVDEEMLSAMKTAGCQRIHYGVEAGTQKILNVLRKGITLEQALIALKLTKKIGIESAAYFMIGSPSETKEDILQTIKFMKKLDPDYAQIAITTPFPATDLYRIAQEQGVINGDPWREFAKNPVQSFIPPIWEKELSRSQLSALLRKAYRSFYMRPSFIIKKLVEVRSLHELWQKSRAALRMLGI